MTSRIIALLIVAVALASSGCGSSSSSDDQMVWCVAPGEKVDAAFRREYPDLYMPKKTCDLFD